MKMKVNERKRGKIKGSIIEREKKRKKERKKTKMYQIIDVYMKLWHSW